MVAALFVLDVDVGGKGGGAVLEPVEGDALIEFLFLMERVEIGHEDFEARLCRHAAVAVAELGFVVDQIEVEPGVIGGVDEGEIGGMHGEVAEAEGSSLEAQEVVPLGELGLIVGGIAVDQDEVGTCDGDAGEQAFDVRRRKKGGGVEEDVISDNLDAGHGRGAHEIVDLDVQAAEERFDREFEDADFFDVKMDAAVGSGGEGTDEFDRERHVQLVHGAGELELITLAAHDDVFEWKVNGGGAKKVTDVTEVGVDDTFVDTKDKGFRVVERGIDTVLGAQHPAADPGDVDAELGALAKHDVVGVDSNGGAGGWALRSDC